MKYVDGIIMIAITIILMVTRRQTHYKNTSIQIWDFIIANNIGYMEGNAIKYLARWRDKGGIEDLKKARHYIDKLIEVETAKGTK